MSVAGLRLSRGTRAWYVSTMKARTAGKPRAGGEREGQRKKRRRPAEKATEEGKRENHRTGPKREHTEADRTQTGGERRQEARGQAAEAARNAKSERPAGTREQHETLTGNSGAEFAASDQREREPQSLHVRWKKGGVVPAPDDSLPPLRSLSTDLRQRELPAQNDFVYSPRGRSSPNEANGPSKLISPHVQGARV